MIKTNRLYEAINELLKCRTQKKGRGEAKRRKMAWDNLAIEFYLAQQNYWVVNKMPEWIDVKTRAAIQSGIYKQGSANIYEFEKGFKACFDWFKKEMEIIEEADYMEIPRYALESSTGKGAGQ